ncbi:hypothetical protein HMPREF1505_1742 [Prevotella sp. ICM33]|nr:hypothetical protein HMPREF1505_1742 [Prevotella sp. ICM33]
MYESARCPPLSDEPRGAAAAAADLSCSASLRSAGARAPLRRKASIACVSRLKPLTSSPPFDGHGHAARPGRGVGLDLPFPAERMGTRDDDCVADLELRVRRGVQRGLIVRLFRRRQLQESRDRERAGCDEAPGDETLCTVLHEVAVRVASRAAFYLYRGSPLLHHQDSSRDARRSISSARPRPAPKARRSALVR